MTNEYIALAPAGIFVRGEARSIRGGLVRGVAAWGVPGGGRSPPDAGEVFKNIVKNNERFTTFYKFSRKFRDFSNFF